MSGTIAAMQATADQLAGWNLGYDQNNRWDIKDGGECDCSSSSGWIIKRGGYPIDLSGTFYTGNFAAKAKAAGFSVLAFKNLAQVKPGDFLLTPGHHVVFARDASRWFSAEFDERGKAAGGQAGDQNGRETRYRAPYIRPGGWKYIVRPPAEATTISTPTALSLRVGWAAQQAPHFGGSSDYAARARSIAKLGASVVGMSETLITASGKNPHEMQASIAANLGKGWTYATHPRGAVALFWYGPKYRRSVTRSKTFGARNDPWHGALCVPLRRLDCGVGVDFISVHVRPRGAFPKDTPDSDVLAEKRADVTAALSLVGKWPAVIMGDFAQDADEPMAAAGFVRVTPDADSYTKGGHMDAIYVQVGVLQAARPVLLTVPTSDHGEVAATVSRANITTV